ncbi:MAG: hypothetical protein WB697_10145 [Stellaceae bacterium]
MARGHALVLFVALVTQAWGPAWGQRLLYGTWQGAVGQSTATLTIITVGGDGWIHGILRYDPPQADGFAGSPFTTQIDKGAFAIGLVNGTRYADMHWCRDDLCGTYYTPDGTVAAVDFARPAK